MEHMDLLSGSSSEDMDLASDHEKPSAGAEKTPTSAEASCIEDLQLEGDKLWSSNLGLQFVIPTVVIQLLSISHEESLYYSCSDLR